MNMYHPHFIKYIYYEQVTTGSGVASWVEKVDRAESCSFPNRRHKFSTEFRQAVANFSNRGDYGCSKFQFRPEISPKLGFSATNLARSGERLPTKNFLPIRPLSNSQKFGVGSCSSPNLCATTPLTKGQNIKAMAEAKIFWGQDQAKFKPQKSGGVVLHFESCWTERPLLLPASQIKLPTGQCVMHIKLGLLSQNASPAPG